MITYETFARIIYLSDQKGLTPAQIARETGHGVRTVRKWLRDRQFHPRKPVIRKSKIDPFKDSVVWMLEAHPYTARQIFQRLGEEGYDGCYSVVKRFVKKIRPRREKAYLTLAFAPANVLRWTGGRSARLGWVRLGGD